MLSKFIDKIRRKKLSHLKKTMNWKKKEMEIKKNSTSLLWVWEFSKKAVLICFSFYVVVQVYSMVVMVKYYDFTHLGELIDQTGQIVQNCVFAYLAKSGIENFGKIFYSHKQESTNESDETVG